VDVAHAFYSGAEPGLVNGVLDKLARKFRDQEMAAGRG
jgi:N utilization substance protein B